MGNKSTVQSPAVLARRLSAVDGAAEIGAPTGGTVSDVINSDIDVRYKKASSDFSGLVKTDGKTVVITGDSLSYNNYGFGFPFAANAYDCNPGLRSWPFLLRDAIHMSDPCFVYADTIPWHANNDAQVAVAVNNTNPFVLPFNNRSLRVVANNAAAELSVLLNSFNIVNKKIILHLAHAAGESGKFDIYFNDNDGGGDVFVETVEVGNGVNFNGYQPFAVEVPVNTLDCPARIIFKNFTNDDGTTPVTGGVAFYLLGAGSKLTNVHMTGAGGWTAEDLEANFAARVGDYTPDLLILSLGANDRLLYSLERHLTALTNIFAAARVANPAVRIILVTSPPAVGVDNPGYYPDTETNVNGLTMREWVGGVEALCRSENVLFCNLYRYLYGIDENYLFVDGIHLSRNAGRDVFASMVSDYFKNCGAPIEHLGGYTTYSVQGTGDLMGRQIASLESTRAAIRIKGQFKITYTHGTTSWAVSEAVENSMNKSVAFKGISIDVAAHTNILEFWVPCVSTVYREFYSPISATAEYVGGVDPFAVTLSIKTRASGSLTFTIRDGAGALIDPSTMDGAEFLIKYGQW